MLKIDLGRIAAIEAILRAAENEIKAKTGLDVRVGVNGAPGSQLLTLETVVQTVSDVFRISPISVVGKNRQLPVAWARHIVCWFLVSRCGWNEKEVGDQLNRDRTTIINSVATTKNLLDSSDPDFTPSFEACMAQLSKLFKTKEDEA